MMRKLYVMALVATLLAACGTPRTAAEKAVLRQRTAQQVEQALAERHYTIAVDYMQPAVGPTRRLDYGYSLTVKGDTLNSYLPYFGRAYSVPYGGGKGLNFVAPIVGYAERQMKPGLREIVIETDNKEDQLQYVLSVFENGSTSIMVYARQRERIGFTGNMELDK